MIKNRNFKLMLLIIFFIILFLGIGSIILNSVIFKKNTDDDQYKTDEDISVPVVSNVGLPDGEIGINNDIVQHLFEIFREDHNCMYNYVNNINGTNKSRLVIVYNYLVDRDGVSNVCSNYNNLVINGRYFCSDTLDINYTLYNYGINSNQFLDYLKNNNTVELDGGLFDQEMNRVFGNGVGYIKEDFLYSNDSYIHYDPNTNKYIMYKYFSNSGACKNYSEELVSAASSNGVLEITSKLMEGNNTIRNIKRTFKYEDTTGNYIFQNRYVI